MVGPGEVDEDLEAETMEECSKYGRVLECKIIEIPPPVDDSKAVRIFLHFATANAAQKGQNFLFFLHPF
jgi:splicing factor 45